MPWTRRDLYLDDKPVPLGNLRSNGLRDLLVYCGDAPRCQHGARPSTPIDGPDEVTLGELQPRMLCTACGHKGADVRPLWSQADGMTGGPIKV